MTTRRSRPPRSRKTRAAEPLPNDVALRTSSRPLGNLDAFGTADTGAAAGAAGGHEHAPPVDPTETGQLRALEAGWDALLS